MDKITNFMEKLYIKRPDLIGEISQFDDYINMNTKIRFMSKYGMVSIIPASLYNKGTSPSLKSAIDKNEYLANMFNAIHNNKYDYSLVEYITNRHRVKIICKEHGIFYQIVGHHLNGHGCAKCAGCFNLTNEEFIDRSIKIHGDRYDYSLVNYINNRTKVKIICKEHGVFTQIPDSHTRGYICRKCAYTLLNPKGGYNKTLIERYHTEFKNKKAILYKFRLYNDAENFYKIGITTGKIKRRMSNIPYQIEVISIDQSNLYDCFYREQELLNKYKPNVYKPKIKFSGYTECFSKI